MRRRLLALLTVAVPAAGCADLVVHKVPVDKRIAGSDQHVDGFRYYLSRPYIAVNAPVEVSRIESLVILKDGFAVTFLNGVGAGKTIPLDQLTTTNPGTGAVQRVSQAELAAMRSLIESRAEKLASNSTVDPGVRPAALAKPAPSDALMNSFAAATIGPPSEAFAARVNEGAVVQAAPPTPETPASAKDRHSVHLNGHIQIVFLPDMDEQYAIESRNFVSKSSFTLKFQDGWELSDVYADHDATPVALELLNTIDQAIDTAKTLRSHK